MALADLRQHSLESEITLIEEVHPPPPSSDTMSIYMMSNSIDPLISTSNDDPSDLSLPLFPQRSSIRIRNLRHNLNLSYQGNSGVHS